MSSTENNRELCHPTVFFLLCKIACWAVKCLVFGGCTSAGVMDVPPAVTGRRVQNSRSWHCPNPLTKPQPMRPRHHGVSENLSVSVSVCPLLQWAKSGVLDYMLWWRDSHTANPRSPVSHTDQCDVYLYVSGVNSLIWPALNSISATALQRGWHNCPCITWCCCLMAFEARNTFIVSVLKTLIHVLRIESQAWSLSALMYDSLFMLDSNQCPLTVSYGVVWSGVTVDYKNVGGLQHGRSMGYHCSLEVQNTLVVAHFYKWLWRMLSDKLPV